MTSPTTAGVARWRRGWLPLAGLAIAAQVLFFWLLSLPGDPVEVQAPGTRTLFAMTPAAEPAFEDWLWLMNPGLFLLPSTRDFSGSAWMEVPPREVVFEPLTVSARPLPYAPVARVARGEPLLPRPDPGPAHRWEVPSSVVPLPAVAPAPLPARTTLRRLVGLEDWHWPEGLKLPAAPEGEVAGVTVLRVTIDATGEVAAPPLIWESSGVPAADELAVQLIAALRFERAFKGQQDRDNALAWGLVGVDWATAVPSP